MANVNVSARVHARPVSAPTAPLLEKPLTIDDTRNPLAVGVCPSGYFASVLGVRRYRKMRRLACPACDKPLLVPDGQVRKRLPCPTCGRRLQVAADSTLAIVDDKSHRSGTTVPVPRRVVVPLIAPVREAPPETTPNILSPCPPPAPPRPDSAEKRLPWWLLAVAGGSGVLVAAIAVLSITFALVTRSEPDHEAVFVPSIVDPLNPFGRAGVNERAKPPTPDRPAVGRALPPTDATAARGGLGSSADRSSRAPNEEQTRQHGAPAGRHADDPIQAVLRSVAVVSTESGDQGSGFVAAPGILVTNDHVIEDMVIRDVRIAFPDHDVLAGLSLRAELIHVSVVDDLAFLAIEGDVQPLTIKPEYRHFNGQRVVAVGSPGSGDNGPTLENLTTDGRLGPELALDGDGKRWALSMAVNGGNSGGPLVDAQTGEVIGVIVAKFTKTEAQSLAIPHAALVRELAKASQASQQSRAAVLSLHRQRYCLRQMADILRVTGFAFERSIAAAMANSDAGDARMYAAFNECKTSTAKVFADKFANFSGTVGGEVEDLQNDPNCDLSVRRGLRKLLGDIEDQADEIRRRVPHDEILDFLGRFRASCDGSRALLVSLAKRLQISHSEGAEVE